MPHELNHRVALRLEEVARLLEEQGANPFRVRAWRDGGSLVRQLVRPVDELLAERGLDGLRELPRVGEVLARAIRDLVTTGRLPMLERLRGAVDAERLLRTVPGIGPVLAARLHHDLGIDSLEELETAAHDGRLSDLAGLGEKRLAGIRDSLASRLQRVRVPVATDDAAPPVGELLDVDREYRRRAAAGELRRIAPRRFNPAGRAWLPILHTARAGRQYTALFSNTARAHRLGHVGDWVVLYCEAGDGEHQYTVVTGQRGPLAGRRLVPGREAECRRYYEVAEPEAPAGSSAGTTPGSAA
jgi:putative hydrolase